MLPNCQANCGALGSGMCQRIAAQVPPSTNPVVGAPPCLQRRTREPAAGSSVTTPCVLYLDYTRVRTPVDN